jgi:hypothetical protein
LSHFPDEDDGMSAACRLRLSRHGLIDIQTKNAFYLVEFLERSRWLWSAGGSWLAHIFMEQLRHSRVESFRKS